ncbi:MAG: hypothetical protein HY298_15565 [Verrucomicrobia bacterium]|nr:hypothetical protein [Verrucomicrobiota bacterium]
MKSEQHVSTVNQEAQESSEDIAKQAQGSVRYGKPVLELQNLRRYVLLIMSRTPRGQMGLHLLALRKNGNFRWHLAGVIRELRSRPPLY